MICLRIQVPYASFRKSYARAYAETYAVPPPASVYGMLLSLVGEWKRARHEGVALAFAYARKPRVSTTLRKLSRFKYGVAAKQSKLGNAPDYVETLCGLDFLCWIDSSDEKAGMPVLEERIRVAIETPEKIERSGILSLGASDDAVDSVDLCKQPPGVWHWLIPRDDGDIELPVWVDHVGSRYTRWRRFLFESTGVPVHAASERWRFVQILDPRPRR
jgi:CRISPR-associated protein Cas5t